VLEKERARLDGQIQLLKEVMRIIPPTGKVAVGEWN
jgi:hypothetical protein